MPPRLIDLYRPGDLVEIFFATAHGRGWQRGRVVEFQPPGAWVQLEAGGLWFVTNTRRIRPCKHPSSPE